MRDRSFEIDPVSVPDSDEEDDFYLSCSKRDEMDAWFEIETKAMKTKVESHRLLLLLLLVLLLVVVVVVVVVAAAAAAAACLSISKRDSCQTMKSLFLSPFSLKELAMDLKMHLEIVAPFVKMAKKSNMCTCQLHGTAATRWVPVTSGMKSEIQNRDPRSYLTALNVILSSWNPGNPPGKSGNGIHRIRIRNQARRIMSRLCGEVQTYLQQHAKGIRSTERMEETFTEREISGVWWQLNYFFF